MDADLLPCAAETLDRLLGADDRWTNPAAMMDPSQSVGQTPAAKELRLLADELVTLLDAQTPHLIAASSRDDWNRARLVRWMRAYNDGPAASQRLRFVGFAGPLEITGAASPRQALSALHG